MRLLLRRILPALLAILLLLLAALTWLAGTESGLRVLWQHLLRPAVPQLVSGEVTGRLAGTIVISDLRYETDQLVFAARSLQLAWESRELLKRVVHIRRLAGEGSVRCGDSHRRAGKRAARAQGAALRRRDPGNTGRHIRAVHTQDIEKRRRVRGRGPHSGEIRSADRREGPRAGSMIL